MPHSIPEDLELPVRSLRCSDYGDDNFTNEQVTYTSYDQHFTELKHFMDNGTYYSMKEFFGPVRLRRHNHDMHDIDGALQEGIDYLEFRNFDLDPLSRTGISDDTINFLILQKTFKDKCILAIAPGKRLARSKKEIEKYIHQKRPIIVTNNFFYEEVETDYSFFSNSNAVKTLSNPSANPTPGVDGPSTASTKLLYLPPPHNTF